MLSLDNKKFASFKFLFYYFICADCSLMHVQGQQFSIKEDCWWTNTVIQSFNLLCKVFICTSQLLAHVQSQQFSIKEDCWWTYNLRMDLSLTKSINVTYKQRKKFICKISPRKITLLKERAIGKFISTLVCMYSFLEFHPIYKSLLLK